MSEPSMVVIHDTVGIFMVRPKRPVHVTVEYTPCFVVGRPGAEWPDRISSSGDLERTVASVVGRYTVGMDEANVPAGTPIRMNLMATIADAVLKALVERDSDSAKGRLFVALHSVKVMDVNSRTIEVQP